MADQDRPQPAANRSPGNRARSSSSVPSRVSSLCIRSVAAVSRPPIPTLKEEWFPRASPSRSHSGFPSGQAAIALAGYGHRVTIVIRGSDLADSMSQYLLDRIEQHPDIEILSQSVLREAGGDTRLERVVVEHPATSSQHTIPASALFVLIGAEPHTEWLDGTIELDDHGFIVTGPALEHRTRQDLPWTALDRDPYLLETSLPGIFAAGDVRSDSIKRVAAAVGEGSIAVRFVSEHLGRRAGLAAAAPPSR